MLTDSERAARHAAAQEAHRKANLAGLRALLEFLESNPDVPFSTVQVLFFPDHISDELDHAAVDEIAAKLSVIPGWRARHYIAERRYGRDVEYRAVAVPAALRGYSPAPAPAVTA